MRGQICFHADGSITQLRVYESPDAATTALQDWVIGGGDRWLLLDHNWFAIGPLKSVEAIRTMSRSDGTPTQTIPNDQSATPNPLDECVQFISGTISTFLTDKESFLTDRDAFDRVVPGTADLIGSLMNDRGTATLRELQPEDAAFESELSQLGPDIKSFCATHPLTAVK